MSLRHPKPPGPISKALRHKLSMVGYLSLIGDPRNSCLEIRELTENSDNGQLKSTITLLLSEFFFFQHVDIGDIPVTSCGKGEVTKGPKSVL